MTWPLTFHIGTESPLVFMYRNSFVYTPGAKSGLCVGCLPALSRSWPENIIQGALSLTASNLKESNVGKIICQWSIQSSRQETCLYFQCSCITMRINWAMICAFEVSESSALSVTTMLVIHSKGRQNLFILEGLCIWQICSPVKDNFIASSHVCPLLKDYSDLFQLWSYCWSYGHHSWQ